MSPREFRRMCREGQYNGLTRGVALGYLQCNLVVLRPSLPTKPAGPFRGNLVVTMRWLSPEQSIRAVQVTSRYPFNHGAPIHIGNPAGIGADLERPLVGRPVDRVPDGVVALFWAC